MHQSVWILGGYQSDFARNLTNEDVDFADLTSDYRVENAKHFEALSFGGSTATTVSPVVSAAED
jgi:hypothetical protein